MQSLFIRSKPERMTPYLINRTKSICTVIDHISNRKTNRRGQGNHLPLQIIKRIQNFIPLEMNTLKGDITSLTDTNIFSISSNDYLRTSITDFKEFTKHKGVHVILVLGRVQ